MAQYTRHFTCGFDDLLRFVERSALQCYGFTELEEETRFANGNMQCVTRVYTQRPFWGRGRTSLTVTLFGGNGDIHLSAITVGGGNTVLNCVNEWNEEKLLKKFVSQMEAINP